MGGCTGEEWADRQTDRETEKLIDKNKIMLRVKHVFPNKLFRPESFRYGPANNMSARIGTYNAEIVADPRVIISNTFFFLMPVVQQSWHLTSD